jgi:hypothetical protein
LHIQGVAAVATRYTWFAGRCAVPALSATGLTVTSIQMRTGDTIHDVVGEEIVECRARATQC